MTTRVSTPKPIPLATEHSLVRRPGTQVDQAKTIHAAKDFEAMTLDQMLQPMFATLEGDPTFGGGEAEKTLQPLLVTEMAKMMEQRGGLGLSKAIADKMMQLQETR